MPLFLYAPSLYVASGFSRTVLKAQGSTSDAIRVRHYSRRTEEAYVTWTRRFIVFHGKQHPTRLTTSHISAFLSWLATDRHVSASTQNQALSAVLFLYRDVLRIEIGQVDGVVRASTPARLPVVLTRAEVSAVLAEAGELSHVPALVCHAPAGERH